MISSAQLSDHERPRAANGLPRSQPLTDMPGAVTVEQVDAREYRAEIVSLFEQDGKLDFHNQFDWYYRDRGQEMPFSWLLRDRNGRIQGLISVTLRPLRFGGITIRAGIAGNLIVDRKSGIYFGASSLVRAIQALVHNNSADVILGIPNEFSQPIFHRLKFRILDHWRTYAQLFRCRHLLSSRLGFAGAMASPFLDLYSGMRRLAYGCQGRPFGIVELDEDRLTDLGLKEWQHSQKHLATVSTAEYLQWRFLRHPTRQYSLWGVRTESGELCGYVVLRCTPGRLWVVDCDVDVSRLTKVEAIVCFCRHAKASIDTIWVPSLSSGLLAKNLAACGFVPVSASMGGYPDYPVVGFWRDDHPMAGVFSQASSWDLLPGFNDV